MIVIGIIVGLRVGGIDMFFTNIETNYEGTIETIKFILKHKDYISSADFNYFGEGSREFFSKEIDFTVWESLRHIVSGKDYLTIFELAELEVLVKYLLLTIIFKYKDKYMRPAETFSYIGNSYSYTYCFEYDKKVYSVRTRNEAEVWISTVRVDGSDVSLWKMGNVLMYYFMNDIWKDFHMVYEKDLKSYRRALAIGLVEEGNKIPKANISMRYRGGH